MTSNILLSVESAVPVAAGPGYHFFDYKYNIEGFTSDLFGEEHIAYIILAFTLTAFLCWLFRHTRHSTVDRLLKVMSIVMPVLEITKVTWESWWDVSTGRGFNWTGLLPIYTCSLFMYALLVAAWGKGRAKEYCLSFITTVSLLYGAVGIIYCNGLNWYPFWTFGAFYSLFFHTSMFATGFFLLATGYKKLELNDAFKAMVPVLALCVIAIPADYILHTDYMMIWDGGGVPFYHDLALWLASMGLRPIYTAIMIITHIPLAMIVIGGYRVTEGVIKAVERKPEEQKETA